MNGVLPVETQAFVRDAAFFAIDGGAVVFVPKQKRLYSLNRPAALVWQALREGTQPREIATSLMASYGLDAANAELWYSQAVESFGALADDAHPEFDERRADLRGAPAMPPSAATYQLLNQTIRIAGPARAIEAIETLLGHLRRPPDLAPAEPELWITIAEQGETFVLDSGGDPTSTATLQTLVAEVERRIVQDAVPRVPHFLSFHAALLERNGSATLLSAPSGSGKTTLAVALAKAGWNLLSDELALVDRDLSWRGLPLRPCIKVENEALIAQFNPAIRMTMAHERFGRRVKFLPMEVATEPVSTRIVVFPRFAAGERTQLVAVDPADGLARLLSQCIYVPPGFVEHDVRRLLDWHATSRYLDLVFGSVAEAVSSLEQVL